MKLIIKPFSTIQAYQPIWRAMQHFNANRNEATTDEIWLLEHEPVFTQGQAGKAEHILDAHQIPIVQTDRGGQVTYHGPGQLMIYTLLDVKRLGLNTRSLVTTLENLIVAFLADLNINAQSNPNAPGVYVDGAKICSIGLRLRKHCCFHGLAFNVNMDLTPFSYINPCGFKNLRMSQIKDFHPRIAVNDVIEKLIPYFSQYFGYNQTSIFQTLAPE